MSESEWVEIVHPDLPSESQSPGGGRAVVTREAFDEVWQEKGWVQAEPEAAPPVEPPAEPEGPAYASVPTEAVDPAPTEPEPEASAPKSTTKKGK